MVHKEKDKYTFEDLSVIMEDILRIHGHQLTKDPTGDSKKTVEIEVKMGGVGNVNNANKSVPQQQHWGSAAAAKTGRGRVRGRGRQRGRGQVTYKQKPRNYPPCEFCGQTSHGMHNCQKLTHGPEVRQKLKS